MTKNNDIDTIIALRECHDICLETFALHCMKVGGHHMAREHIRRMESCIELCNLTANFLLRHSPLTQELCDLTADICKQCAASCDGMDDPKMNECVCACECAALACLDESHHLRAMAA
jgi:hypothetical protein